jgi:hypothetical protein
MKRRNGLTRRSFVTRVTGGGIVMSGGAIPLLGSDALAFAQSGCTDRDPTPNRSTRDPGGQGVGCANTTAPGQTPYSGCSDNDPTDDYQRGRHCGAPGAGGTNAPGQGPYSGCSDSDPTDDFQRGRTCAPRGGSGTAAPSGCSDSDPTDPARNGRNCGGSGSGSGSGSAGGAYQTGRRERRYEVCWVDHPSRGDNECNIQTYSEWQTTWSDGRVEYDTSESLSRRAEMTARGYTARSHRMIVNEWVGQ